MTGLGYTLLMWWIAPALAAAPAAIELDYAAVTNDPWLRRRGLRLGASVSPAPRVGLGGAVLVAPPWSQADLTPLLRDVLERTARRPNMSRVLLYGAPEVRLRLLETRDDNRGAAMWLHIGGGLTLTDVPVIERNTLTVDPEQTLSGWHGAGSAGIAAHTWRNQWGVQVRVDAQLYRQPYSGGSAWESPIWLSVGLSRRTPSSHTDPAQ